MDPKTAFKLANLLSASRLPLAIGYGIFMILADAKAITQVGMDYKVMWLVLAVICVMLVMLTDWADGFVARRYNAVSEVGKFVDPIFDVVFFISAFGVLCWIDYMWWIAFAAVVVRELSQHLLIRPLMSRRGINVAARLSGKMKTATQCVVVMTLTAQPLVYKYIVGWDPNPSDAYKFWAKIATAILAGISVISIIPYIIALLKGKEDDKAE